MDKFKLGMIFELKDTAKIYIINNYNDLKFLIDTYPLKNNPFDYIKLLKSLIDFNDISNHYDGILLTAAGESETRFSTNGSLYGWDVESLLLFNSECINKSSIDFIQISEVEEENDV